MFILAGASDMCENLAPFISIIKIFLQIIRWTVPILLIVLGTFDMFKAVSSNDEKAANEAKSKFIKRIIYGVIVFLVPFFVNLIFELVGDLIPEEDGISATSWVSCWKNSDNKSFKSESTTKKSTTKKTNDSSKKVDTSKKDKECSYECNNGGKLNNNNECYKRILDSYYFDGGSANCNATCGSNATKASYKSVSDDGFIYCDCYYQVTKKCS